MEGATTLVASRPTPMREAGDAISFLEWPLYRLADFLYYSSIVTSDDRAVIASGLESSPVRRVECNGDGLD